MDELNTKNELQKLADNIFELHIRDEFLPIYTHSLYTKLFKENSIAVEISPDKLMSKKFNRNSLIGGYPMGASIQGTSPLRTELSIGKTSPLKNTQNSISRFSVGTKIASASVPMFDL